MESPNLSLQKNSGGRSNPTPIVVLGEVLWDILPTCNTLGGAPLNFAVHVKRLGHKPLLVSALGNDALGRQAAHAIECLGLTTRMLQITDRRPTGTASVKLDRHGQPTFAIHRPAAYDAVRVTDSELDWLSAQAPTWFYYGTLFASTSEGKATFLRLMEALPDAARFYDVNLRPGFALPALVLELLGRATVVKLNEDELVAVSHFAGLPATIEEFCKAGAERFGWSAVCVTLGARGCAILANGKYLASDGYPVVVADSVGAGDAFAAALLHGFTEAWPLSQVATFANRVGAVVASRVGAIPEWSVSETAQL
jgi:fructokinase